jgi:peptidoglycan/LPS O-acetylase OafA/YrhL
MRLAVRGSKGHVDGHWPLLDFIRLSAALLVLFGHARGTLLEGIATVEHPTILIRAFYLISGLQHEGVILFFVVSGFLVGGSAWRLIGEGRFQYRGYFINRFVRIYLVYVPSLIFVLVLDQIGKSFLLDTRPYGVRSLPLTWDEVACHLVTLQGIMCGAWAANPPLWSLGYEWLFYLVAPLLFIPMLVSKRRNLFNVVAPTAILMWLAWRNPEWPIWFGMWLLGVLAARVFETRPVSTLVGACGILVCCGGLMLSRLKIVPLTATDIVVAISIAIAISSRTLMQFGDLAFVRRGAGLSYSLYVVHFPVCMFVAALYERWLQWPAGLVQPDLSGVAGFVGIVAIALSVAWLFARVTEDHTPTVRRWLAHSAPAE